MQMITTIQRLCKLCHHIIWWLLEHELATFLWNYLATRTTESLVTKVNFKPENKCCCPSLPRFLEIPEFSLNVPCMWGWLLYSVLEWHSGLLAHTYKTVQSIVKSVCVFVQVISRGTREVFFLSWKAECHRCTSKGLGGSNMKQEQVA